MEARCMRRGQHTGTQTAKPILRPATKRPSFKLSKNPRSSGAEQETQFFMGFEEEVLIPLWRHLFTDGVLALENSV